MEALYDTVGQFIVLFFIFGPFFIVGPLNPLMWLTKSQGPSFDFGIIDLRRLK